MYELKEDRLFLDNFNMFKYFLNLNFISVFILFKFKLRICFCMFGCMMILYFVVELYKLVLDSDLLFLKYICLLFYGKLGEVFKKELDICRFCRFGNLYLRWERCWFKLKCLNCNFLIFGNVLLYWNILEKLIVLCFLGKIIFMVLVDLRYL